MENNKSSKLTKWLESLQQESWQLELIISGFAIFLVGSLEDPLSEWGTRMSVATAGIENNFILMLPLIIMYSAWFFLLINLVLHLILRGLWISTIGLRYVSGDIDWDELNFQPKFQNYLQSKIGSYDEYIERLEKLCSVVFAFTFMIIFIFISFGLWLMTIIFLIEVFQKLMSPILSESTYMIVKRVIFILWVTTGIFYFVDFLTLGWLKRRKWASKFYYPIYRFYSVITMASLYRPIYYNLIDHKYGRTLSKLMIPYILILSLLASFSIEYHGHYPTENKDGNILSRLNYDDEREILGSYVDKISLPSKYVSNGFLDVFIKYKENRESAVIEKICPNLKPQREVGIRSDFIIGFNSAKDDNMSTDSSLICVQSLYQISVDDSLFTNLSARFFRYPKYGERGLKTIIDVDYLPRGEHLLKVDFQNISNDSLYWEKLEVVPFWKE